MFALRLRDFRPLSAHGAEPWIRRDPAEIHDHEERPLTRGAHCNLHDTTGRSAFVTSPRRTRSGETPSCTTDTCSIS